jgi:hypothetical protein
MLSLKFCFSHDAQQVFLKKGNHNQIHMSFFSRIIFGSTIVRRGMQSLKFHFANSFPKGNLPFNYTE